MVYRVSTNFSCTASTLRIHGLFKARANLKIIESSALLLQRRWPRLKEGRGTCPNHTGWRQAGQSQRFQFILSMHMLNLIFNKVSISTTHPLQSHTLKGIWLHDGWKSFQWTVSKPGGSHSLGFPLDGQFRLVRMGVGDVESWAFASFSSFLIQNASQLLASWWNQNPKEWKRNWELVKECPVQPKPRTASLRSTSVAVFVPHTLKVNVWQRLLARLYCGYDMYKRVHMYVKALRKTHAKGKTKRSP